jgi:lipopolysaccharide/colanic/teichoic acid biosynthesis glycosyltransferase
MISSLLFVLIANSFWFDLELEVVTIILLTMVLLVSTLTEPLDKIIAATLSPLLVVAYILLALPIKSTKGPIFFLQVRIGRDLEKFVMVKFRSMNKNKPANLPNSDENKEHESGRVTTIGKFLRLTKLDELPQLINVMRGEMALVGWRSVLPEHLNNKSLYAISKTLPGITGLEQTWFKRETKGYRQAHLDKLYADKKSWLLDMYLLFIKTPLYIGYTLVTKIFKKPEEEIVPA